MPFYEYQCQACGAQVEVMQKISDAPLRKCPECGKSKLVKLVSAPVFRLKGSGWYETDFKSDSDKKRNLAGAEKDAPAAAATDAKPAADAVKAEPAKDPKQAAPAADKPAAKPVRSASAARSKAKPSRRAAKTGRK
jgi:putative FmdB family regulatory protein